MSESRIQPQSVEMERAVLGAAMVGGHRAVGAARDSGLSAETFYHPAHRRIANTILSLNDRNQEVDQVSVVDLLLQEGHLDEVGGPAYIAELAGEMATAANIEFHTERLLEQAERRGVISRSGQVTELAYDPQSDIETIRELGTKVIQETDKAEKVVFTAGESSDELAEYFAWREEHEGEIPGISYGNEEIDELTLGAQDSELTYIAARPSHGKTAKITDMVRKHSIDVPEGTEPIRCAFFSAEMAVRPLQIRIASAVAQVDGNKVRSWNGCSTEERQRIREAMDKVRAAPIHFIHEVTDIERIRRESRRLVREHNIQIIYVDYLQFLFTTTKDRDSREQQVAYMSRCLKNLAKELGIPIVCAVQLSRAVEYRSDRKPSLADLRESGGIEQDADVVIFVNQPGLYGITEDDDGNSLEGLCQLIIGKQRNGPLGESKTRFDGRYGRFETWDGGAASGSNGQAASEAGQAPSEDGAEEQQAQHGVGAQYSDFFDEIGDNDE